MSISEIEQIYSQYEVNALLPSSLPQMQETEAAIFPSRIQPPTAFIADKQIISNVSNPHC